MARQMTVSTIGGLSKLRCAPRQRDLFTEPGAAACDGGPAWPDLPEDARNTLVGLMTQLMLKHARATAATGVGRDC
jgi:hypothetical protein